MKLNDSVNFAAKQKNVNGQIIIPVARMNNNGQTQRDIDW